jgi:3-dehydroquinate synthase
MSDLHSSNPAPAAESDSIKVELGERSYDIHVGAGLIANAGRLIAPLLKKPETIIVTDENVAAVWLDPLKESLGNEGIAAKTLIMKPGEATKNFDNLQVVTDFLLTAPVERSSVIIALGGGVIGDLTGFAAASTLRGIDFVQIPTTLLAQVDSSVGGKTGINTSHGKNLIGAFHQPRLVLADTGALATLPDRERQAGYAEIIKYGLIGDASFFAWLEDNGSRILAGDEQALRHAVMQSCRAKAEIVGADEREKGRRALLNFGHTFGHALEAENAYGPALLHGEAVAIGSVLALALSERMDLCPAGCADRLSRHLQSVNMPSRISHIDGANTWKAATLLDHMRVDKKVTGGKLTFILANDIGDAFVTNDVDENEVLTVLEEGLD